MPRAAPNPCRQPLGPTFENLGIALDADAAALAKGMGYLWASWYYALDRPAQRHSAQRLADEEEDDEEVDGT